ncbi:hypothetical protein ABW19_dt0204224 [Dactylella cylindrospora]|nr:hypothetical protein ABW19_dt0204224 [Dactylella cylindrospora]
MAEVLGAVASVVTLLELSEGIAGYIGSIKHSKSELAELEYSILSFQDVLNVISGRYAYYQKTNNKIKLETLDLLFATPGKKSPVEKCKEALEHIHKRLKDLHGLKKLTAPFKDHETKQHLDCLEKLKTLVILANANDQRCDAVTISSYLEPISLTGINCNSILLAEISKDTHDIASGQKELQIGQNYLRKSVIDQNINIESILKGQVEIIDNVADVQQDVAELANYHNEEAQSK